MAKGKQKEGGGVELVVQASTEPTPPQEEEGTLIRCTPRVLAQLVAWIKFSGDSTEAAIKAGITPEQFNQWLVTEVGFADVINDAHKHFLEVTIKDPQTLLRDGLAAVSKMLKGQNTRTVTTRRETKSVEDGKEVVTGIETTVIRTTEPIDLRIVLGILPQIQAMLREKPQDSGMGDIGGGVMQGVDQQMAHLLGGISETLRSEVSINEAIEQGLDPVTTQENKE